MRRSSDACQKAEVGPRGNVDEAEGDLRTGQGGSHYDARLVVAVVVEDLLGHFGYEILEGFPIVPWEHADQGLHPSQPRGLGCFFSSGKKLPMPLSLLLLVLLFC